MAVAILERVAPSRARGLKLYVETIVSLKASSRAFTGAWIETLLGDYHHNTDGVAPSRARGLKQSERNQPIIELSVAPSRARGLKLQRSFRQSICCCRAFTGAWIETRSAIVADSNSDRRAFTGAWIETGNTKSRQSLF